MDIITKIIIESGVFLCLFLLSYLDIKNKSFPSPLTTGMVLVLAMLYFHNIPFGLLAFIFGLLLIEGIYEADTPYVSGVGDLKIIVILGLTVTNMLMFGLMMIFIVIYGTFYVIGMKSLFKKEKEVAFAPVFLAVFITLKIIEVYNGVWI